MWCLVFIATLCALLNGSEGSAIPMWEYLSKQEKMSYLYSMFANQVEEFCDKATMKNCNQELLKYGLGKLKDMPEDHLDTMDPYQRGANNIIWDSMMEGHEMMKSPSQEEQQQQLQQKRPNQSSTTTSSTPKPNSYDDDSFDYGSQSAASARIDNVYRVQPPKDFVYKMDIGRPQYTYPQNFLYIPGKLPTTTTTTTTTTKAPPAAFVNTNYYHPYYHQQQYQNRNQQQQQNSFKTAEQRYQTVPLTGPMVVKVYPDGRPVREPQQTLPPDEDLRQYQMSKVTLPNF